MKLDWEKRIKIDSDWIDRQLINHFRNKDFKITVRGYTPKTSGTKFSCDALIEELGYMLVDYVHSEKSKEKKSKSLTAKFGKVTGQKRLDEALYKEAQDFFGKKDPTTDGKYGELLLFALTESVLKCKMVAHKITGLSNAKDQIKGGDGIFLGNYETEPGKFEPALLIGESKIMQGLSDCIDDAYDSLNRFHSDETSSEFNSMEFIVANNTLFIDDNDIDYDEIYKLLTPGTDEFRSLTLVHPILIMFNTAKLDTIEKRAASNQALEELIKTYMEKEKADFIKKTTEKFNSYPNIQKVYVDFFIFPFNSIDAFRNGMYYNIHKVKFTS